MDVPNYVLPNSLLVLVHLHLLKYPNKDASGYDEHLFDSTRTGIRERTKAMEDICYFLVGKLQGGREHSRSILPTYPCLRPSDTTAFRTSLSKYLESLRHNSIYPSHAEHKAKASENNRSSGTTGTSGGSWWRDVVVRKSLLEECSGERFERLILALSTHTIVECTLGSRLSSSSERLDPSRQYEVLHNLPQAYATLLDSAQAARRSWERSASLLIQQRRDLEILREQLSSPASTTSRSKYDSVSTDRLVALLNSQYDDQFRKQWDSRDALHFLIDLAGLQLAYAGANSSKPSGYQITEGMSDVRVIPTTAPVLLSALPLPIVAAHHPATLLSLSEPLFSEPTGPPSTARSKDGSIAPTQPTVAQAVCERMDAASRTRQALQNALTRSEGLRGTLRARLDALQTALGTVHTQARDKVPDLQLWEDPSRKNFDLQTPPASGFLGSISHRPLVLQTERDLEQRIADIRSSLVPAYPSDTSLPRPGPLESPTAEGPATRLRRPSEKRIWQVQTTDTEVSAEGRVRSAPPVILKTRLPQVQRPMGYAREAKVTEAVAQGARKVSRKRTSRVSMARARRSTMHWRDGFDDEIDKIVESVEDGSPSFQDDMATPKRKGGTVGVPLSTVMKSAPRPSFKIDDGIDVALPKLDYNALVDHDIDVDDPSPGGWERSMGQTNGEKQADSRTEDSEDETSEDYYEGHSVTLKDILIKAGSGDVTQFDLLGDENGPEDEAFEWD